jgi:hypothetical protein
MAKKQAVNGERGRWSAKAKREAVLRGRIYLSRAACANAPTAT